MKKLFFAISIFTLAVSCNKDDVSQLHNSDSGEIIITVDDSSLDVDVQTRTSAESSLPSKLYLGGTTGTSTQTSKWASHEVSVSSGKINTGYYQTATATAYNYYLSNVNMDFTQSGLTVSADGSSKDVIVGVTKASDSTTPSVTMDHVFARTGSVSCSSANGYTLSGLSYKLASKGSLTGTKGTYNIYTKGWSSVTALSTTTLTGSSDLYLIPGVYTLTVSGTESLGDYSKSFSASADITLVGGKVNNISAKRTSSGAQGITVSVSLNPWGTNSITPNI